MTKIEYWDMGDSVFAKTSENGIVASSQKIPKSECPKSILNKFNGANYLVVDDSNVKDPFEEAEEEQEQLSRSPAITSEELSSVLESSSIVEDNLKKESDVKVESLESTKIEETKVLESDNTAKEVLDKPTKKPVKKVSKKEDKYDFVQHPKHYNGHKIITKSGTFEYETIQYLESLVRRLEPDLYSDESGSVYCAAKYMDRIGGGKPDGKKTVREKIAEDCRKIGWYMNHCAELIEANGFEAKHTEGK